MGAQCGGTHPPRQRLQCPGTGRNPRPQPPHTWTILDDCPTPRSGTKGAAFAGVGAAAKLSAPMPSAPMNVRAVSRISIPPIEIHADNDTTKVCNPCPMAFPVSAASFFDGRVELGADEDDVGADIEPH